MSERYIPDPKLTQMACELLVAAYEKGGAENNGQVDWEELDDAYATARAALGLNDQEEETSHEPHDILCLECGEAIDQCLSDACTEDDHHNDGISGCEECRRNSDHDQTSCHICEEFRESQQVYGEEKFHHKYGD